MIYLKTKEDIERMRAAGRIVAATHRMLKEVIRPGITTKELDAMVDAFQRERGGIPAQKGYKGFPWTICASVDDEICHGFPSDTPLKDGALLKVDMVVELDGWMADSAWSYLVGTPSEETERLYRVTKECLYKGIEQARPGNRLGDIGAAIQAHAEAHGYQVVRDFIGHGIGKNMHEDPQVLHYGKAGRGLRLTEGMVFTIEPMINAGRWECKLDANGWTARTVDGSLSCQFEHTIAVTSGEADILTDQEV